MPIQMRRLSHKPGTLSVKTNNCIISFEARVSREDENPITGSLFVDATYQVYLIYQGKKVKKEPIGLFKVSTEYEEYKVSCEIRVLQKPALGQFAFKIQLVDSKGNSDSLQTNIPVQ
jgi:hypothetical protein